MHHAWKTRDGRGSLPQWYIHVDRGRGEGFTAREFFDDVGVDTGFSKGGAEPVAQIMGFGYVRRVGAGVMRSVMVLSDMPRPRCQSTQSCSSCAWASG